MRCRNWAAATALASALGAATGCEESTAGGPPTLDEFTDAMIAGLCDYYTRCIDNDRFLLTGGGSAADCERRLRETMAMGGDIELPTAQWEAALARGTARWDDRLASACLGYLAGASCDDMRSGAFELAHPECWTIPQGNVAPGAACHIDGECANGWCDDSAACPGVCVAFVGQGDACDGIGDVCAPGLQCDPTTTQCVILVPETYLQDGETCDEAAGPECGYARFCAPGDPYHCGATSPTGPCSWPIREICAPGTACLASDEHCHELAMATTAGAECGETILTYCDPLENLTCDRSTGRCVALPANGEPCVYGQCAFDSYCDALVGGTCRTRQALGYSCANDRMCQSNHCEGGRCVPVSEACSSGDLFWAL